MKLTPTEDLVLEVLAARHRLGEHLWTFNSNVGGTITKLEEKGLVTQMHGITERTIRAGLTQAGEELVLEPTYSPPILRDMKKEELDVGLKPDNLSSLRRRASRAVY